jgi:hypothetical protein
MSINQSIAKVVNYLNASSWWASVNIHGWFACTVVYHLGRVWPIYRVAAIFVALTAVKEYYWDKHFEIPAQSFKASSLDWAGYLAGTALALILSRL